VGSNPTRCIALRRDVAPVAQLAEPSLFKRTDAGSTPARCIRPSRSAFKADGMSAIHASLMAALLRQLDRTSAGHRSRRVKVRILPATLGGLD
jgi:hypothetical protein